MWVPWKAGNPGRQARTRGLKTGRQAAAEARQKLRRDAFKRLKAGKINNAQYQRELRKIG